MIDVPPLVIAPVALVPSFQAAGMPFFKSFITPTDDDDEEIKVPANIVCR
jgi:hypothetical protein